MTRFSVPHVVLFAFASDGEAEKPVDVRIIAHLSRPTPHEGACFDLAKRSRAVVVEEVVVIAATITWR